MKDGIRSLGSQLASPKPPDDKQGITMWSEADLQAPLASRIKRETLILALIFSAALFLRLIFFNGLNWDDDPDYVWRAQQVLTGQGLVYTDNNGFRIGTFAPAAFAYAIFGINNFSVGIYALIVSLFSLIIIYKLGRLLFGTETGLIAALLLAVYPLDVELASRLMPDGLLAGFSLLAIYFLFKGDFRNRDEAKHALVGVKNYVWCGLWLGWCTVVNMSSLVLFIFLAAYFFFSLFVFRSKLRTMGFWKGFFKILVLRFVIIAVAFGFVASVEGLLYLQKTHDFFFKYKNTATHFGENRGFNLDMMTYPAIMFHLNSQVKFQFQGLENSYYGFYFIFALFALLYGLTQRKGNAYFVILWLLSVWLYMQWGSMSLNRYMPMHRLPRHLSLVTPPMILVLAYFLGHFRPIEIKKYLSPAVLIFLTGSSLVFGYYRHQSLIDSVLPQKVLHDSLRFVSPRHVYAQNSTIAYQRFLDHYQSRGWEYHDIQSIPQNRPADAYAVLGEHRNWTDTAKIIWKGQYSPPKNWEPVTALKVDGCLKRPPFEVRIYKLLTTPLPEIKLNNFEKTREYLLDKFSDQFKKDSEIILFWSSPQVDGTDDLVLKGEELTLRHLNFKEPADIYYQVFKPIPRSGGYSFKIIKELGRGDVTIIETPSSANNFLLTIRMDDGPFAGADYYRFFLIADKNQHRAKE